VRYSTPAGWVGEQVWCRVEDEELVIVGAGEHGRQEIWRHQLSVPGRPQILAEHYPDHPNGRGSTQPRVRPPKGGRARLPGHRGNATIRLDPFHIVGWAALDKVRRQVWNRVRRAGLRDKARELKDSRWALLKNPEDLTEKQSRKLAVIAQVNDLLCRAYLLKEQLR
jgi:hypothetical protein